MSNITWIVIILIAISIIVTVTEVGLRFGMLSKNKGERGPGLVDPDLVMRTPVGLGARDPVGDLAWELQSRNVSVEEVRRWSRLLGEADEGRSLLCGGDVVGETFKDV